MISSPRTLVFGGLAGGYHENSIHGRTAPSGTCSADWRSRWPAPTFHRYLVRAALTPEGLKNLKKQPPTALKVGVAKFVESVGGKLEFWYFDYGAATAYSVIQY